MAMFIGSRSYLFKWQRWPNSIYLKNKKVPFSPLLVTLLGMKTAELRRLCFLLLVGGLELPIHFTLVAIMKFTHLQRQIISMSWHKDRIFAQSQTARPRTRLSSFVFLFLRKKEKDLAVRDASFKDKRVKEKSLRETGNRESNQFAITILFAIFWLHCCCCCRLLKRYIQKNMQSLSFACGRGNGVQSAKRPACMRIRFGHEWEKKE